MCSSSERHNSDQTGYWALHEVRIAYKRSQKERTGLQGGGEQGSHPPIFPSGFVVGDLCSSPSAEAWGDQVWLPAHGRDLGLLPRPWPQGRTQGHFRGSTGSWTLRTTREGSSHQPSLVLLPLLPEALSFSLGACLLAQHASGKGRALNRFFQR